MNRAVLFVMVIDELISRGLDKHKTKRTKYKQHKNNNYRLYRERKTDMTTQQNKGQKMNLCKTQV